MEEMIQRPVGADVIDAWPLLLTDERREQFKDMPRWQAEDVFLSLGARDQLEVLQWIEPAERRSWVRLLAPDDAARLIQEAPTEDHAALLALLDHTTLHDVSALLAYAEDQAGGLMNPRFGRLRPQMTVREAIGYLGRQSREHAETIYYAYVIASDQTLLGVVSFRALLSADPDAKITDIMTRDIVAVRDDTDRQLLARVFAQSDLMALPIIDADGRIKGIVTADDIVDVVQQQATDDMQRIGGTEALEEPYLEIGMRRMVRKRAGWLVALFLGEMLTATAMSYFEGEIAKAVVLALFVPLIISSGGNAGSQASTLVVRAMALGEARLGDWARVFRRELAAGIVLGLILAAIGFLRIVVWQGVFHTYGEHYLLVAIAVSLSLIGVVLWGTVTGSMLPMLLRRVGFDPATASAPFVATLVDVTGLMIYFTAAAIVLRGTLL